MSVYLCNLIYNYMFRIYLYSYYVPTFMLWSDEGKYIRTDPGLWFWFAAECLDSVSVLYFFIIYAICNT